MCADRNVSTANYELCARTEPATQDLSLKDDCPRADMEVEEVSRVASNLYNVLVQVLKGEAWIWCGVSAMAVEVRHAGACNRNIPRPCWPWPQH